jgi:predicted MFS family arabinose efflux permease
MHKSFDLAGAVTVTAGLVSLVYGIVRSSESGWGSAEVLGFLGLAAVLLVSFVLIEGRSKEPLVRLSIFSVKTVRGANVAMFVVAAGLFAMFFFNTLYVQRVLGFSPLEAGLAFVPFTAGVIIGASLSQKLVPALGAREVPLIGVVLAAAGLLLFLRLTPDSSYVADLLPGIMLTSIGMGLVFVPITLIATSGVPIDDAGLASGLFNTSQQIGGALGLALLSTLATNRTSSELSSLGRAPTEADTADALVSGFHVTWAASATLLLAGGLLLLALLRRRDVAAVAHGEASPVVA